MILKWKIQLTLSDLRREQRNPNVKTALERQTLRSEGQTSKCPFLMEAFLWLQVIMEFIDDFPAWPLDIIGSLLFNTKEGQSILQAQLKNKQIWNTCDFSEPKRCVCRKKRHNDECSQKFFFPST